MELYTFGLSLHPDILTPTNTPATTLSKTHLSPQRVLSSPSSIKIMYTSWCDALIISYPTFTRTSPAHIEYTSTFPCLSATQRDYLITSVSKCMGSKVNLDEIILFANPLGAGLMGLWIPSTKKEGGDDDGGDVQNARFIIFNSTFERMKYGGPEYEEHAWPLEFNEEVRDLAITSGGRTAVYLASRSAQSSTDTINNSTTTNAKIMEFKSPQDFKTWVRNPLASHPLIHATHTIPYHSNTSRPSLSPTSTTFTLHQPPSAQTWTPDPRYPILIGRPTTPSTPAQTPYAIPYLSETAISKIATGSWLSAAISIEGELFFWGMGTLSDNAGGGEEEAFDFLEKGEDEGDEYVKIAEIVIGGGEARVTAVGIGIAHVIVAAETETEGGRGKERAVFAAGRGEQGQLGIGEWVRFCGGFREVVGLRGRVVRDIRCAGWSSWVVVDSEVVDNDE